MNEAHASSRPKVASPFITKPIDEIRPGDRVLARNPEVSDEERANAVEIEPENWRLVEMLLTGEDGHQVNVRLLRPLKWINHHNAQKGGQIELDLEEIGMSGYAGILNISPCPKIKLGKGQVVTGTFRHIAEDLVEVHIADERDPLVCTSGHPFWSEDRKMFVDASDLRPSEKLKKADGRFAYLTEVCRGLKKDSVFNIEVNQEHVYYVGEAGLLVHNVDPTPTQLPDRLIDNRDGFQIRHFYGNTSGEGRTEHAPIHFTVYEESTGRTYRAFPSGQPLSDSEPLPKNAHKIFFENRSRYRRIERRIGKWFRTLPSDSESKSKRGC